MNKNALIPMVIERTADGERSYDLESRLLKDRNIFLDDEVNSVTAGIIMKELLFLDNEDSSKPINFYINSPGGSIYDGLQIIDTMMQITAPVNTIVTGIAASMGAAILVHGEKRFALPNSRVMFHQASSGNGGNVQDMRINMKETEYINDKLADMISKQIGMSKSAYLKTVERDNWLSPEEAMKFGSYGAIDEVIKTKTIKRTKK